MTKLNRAAATQDQHGVRVFVPLERRIAACRDLEVTQFGRLVGRRKENLSRDVLERGAAFLLVTQGIDGLPAEVAPRIARKASNAAHAASAAWGSATARTNAQERSYSRSCADSSDPPMSSTVSVP